MKRVGKRGDNQWETISYEQLIKEVTEGGDLFGEGHVDGLKAIHSNPALANPAFPDFGPNRNRLLGTGSTAQWARSQFFQRFISKSWGTPNFGHSVAYCGISAKGVGANVPSALDVNNTEFAIFIGYNPGLAGESANIGTRRLSNALAERENFKFVVVDPILRASTSHALSLIHI